MTRRRWIADHWDDTTASLGGEQAAHLARVLRAAPGAEYDIVAGGFVWRAAITSVTVDEVRFDLLSEVEADPALPVTLLLSIYKFDRLEWAIEKVTELGIQRIVPVISRRTEKHLAEAAGKRVERWRRVVREASQQSRRSDVPVVGDVVHLQAALKEAGSAVRLVLAEQERTVTLRHAIEANLASDKPVGSQRGIVLAIGPEGGWASEEESLFHAEEWQAVSLGPRILRAETAAITAMSVVASLLE